MPDRLVNQDGVRALSDLEAGTRGVVRQLRGGHEFTARLAALGLTVGAQVKVVQNNGHGPVLVLVRDTRVALGRGEALKVQVDVGAG